MKVAEDLDPGTAEPLGLVAASSAVQCTDLDGYTLVQMPSS